MRHLIAAAAVLFMSVSAFAAPPCDNKPPTSAQRPVNVPFTVAIAPADKMFTVCRKQVVDTVIFGCTFYPHSGKPGAIFLSSALNASERRCTLLYEKAHLPPNNWIDPVMESYTPDAQPS